MTVKVQKPLFPPPPKAMVLVYSKNRKFEVYIPWSKELEAYFSVFGLKQYGEAKFFAEVHEDGDILVFDKFYEEDLGW